MKKQKTDPLSVKKINILDKKIKVKSYKNLFVSLGKMAVGGIALRWEDLAEGALEALASVNLGCEESELAWRLINRSMIEASGRLVFENREHFGPGLDKRGDFLKNTKVFWDNLDFTIDAAFFDKPGQCSIVKEMGELLGQWLQMGGLSKTKAAAIARRLPSYFVFAVNNEWRQDSDRYEPLIKYFKTPFASEVCKEIEWSRYAAALDRQINESVFGEAFSLNQIYVPLRACYYKDDPQNKSLPEGRDQRPRMVVDLQDNLLAWLKADDKNDCLRIVSGGPGCGKSSFAKMFAAEAAAEDEKILFIPLHLIDLKSDLSRAISTYLQNGDFFSDFKLDEEPGLLIIFDGLDELSQQGKACVDVAREFLDEVRRLAELRNIKAPCLKVLITGRELAVQAGQSLFRREGQILHVLPYYVDAAKKSDQEEYLDPHDLLKEDCRDIWWKKFGALSGRRYQGLPRKLKTKEMDELTAQPLLNYLLALSFQRGRIKFSKETNLNSIYSDLIDAVYDRDYERRQHQSIKTIERGDFWRLLEEVAVSAWHGGASRVTTVTEIVRHCQLSNIGPLLSRFQEGAQAGITNLLTAFYFRQHESYGGEKTFEFTHKSFSEYLLVKRLTRQIELTCKKAAEYIKNNDDGWSAKESLIRWGLLCGGGQIDGAIFKFLKDEISLCGPALAKKWQKILCGLIGSVLRGGFPNEALTGKTFKENSIQSRNAEECLLAALNACAKTSGQLSDIRWPDHNSASEWLLRLKAYQSFISTEAYEYLSHINWSRSMLPLISLAYANLEKGEMKDTFLHAANLHGAKLIEADLSEAILYVANLRYAILTGARLNKADLTGAILIKANLTGADLTGANLTGADLTGAILTGAIMPDGSRHK